jgi:hypothetical protein
MCDLETSRMRRLRLIKGCKCQIEEEEEVALYFCLIFMSCARTTLSYL